MLFTHSHTFTGDGMAIKKYQPKKERTKKTYYVGEAVPCSRSHASIRYRKSITHRQLFINMRSNYSCLPLSIRTIIPKFLHLVSRAINSVMLPSFWDTPHLPNAASQARFSWEWCDRLISLSLRIFSRARTMNISFVLVLALAVPMLLPLLLLLLLLATVGIILPKLSVATQSRRPDVTESQRPDEATFCCWYQISLFCFPKTALRINPRTVFQKQTHC